MTTSSVSDAFTSIKCTIFSLFCDSNHAQAVYSLNNIRTKKAQRTIKTLKMKKTRVIIYAGFSMLMHSLSKISLR